MTIEAMKQALEALENAEYGDYDKRELNNAITSLRQAIEQLEKQEPFGYLEIEDIESHSEYPHNCRSVNLWYEGGEGMVAIYTTPPAAQRLWVSLTDEDVYPLANEHLHYQMEGYEVSGIYKLARAIEAKLKEKNT